MQMVPCGNHDGVDTGVGKNFVFVSRAILESEFSRGTSGMGTIRRAHSDQFGSRFTLDGRNQSAGRETAGPQNADPHIGRVRSRFCGENLQLPIWSTIRRVSDQDSKRWRDRATRYLIVGEVGLFNRKAMRNERKDSDF